jgi:hypothetical protein
VVDAERRLSELFELARLFPHIPFVGQLELDTIEERHNGTNGALGKILSPLWPLLDSVTNVMIVGITNNVSSLDDTLIRPRRLGDNGCLIYCGKSSDEEARLVFADIFAKMGFIVASHEIVQDRSAIELVQNLSGGQVAQVALFLVRYFSSPDGDLSQLTLVELKPKIADAIYNIAPTAKGIDLLPMNTHEQLCDLSAIIPAKLHDPGNLSGCVLHFASNMWIEKRDFGISCVPLGFTISRTSQIVRAMKKLYGANTMKIVDGRCEVFFKEGSNPLVMECVTSGRYGGCVVGIDVDSMIGITGDDSGQVVASRQIKDVSLQNYVSSSFQFNGLASQRITSFVRLTLENIVNTPNSFVITVLSTSKPSVLDHFVKSLNCSVSPPPFSSLSSTLGYSLHNRIPEYDTIIQRTSGAAEGYIPIVSHASSGSQLFVCEVVKSKGSKIAIGFCSAGAISASGMYHDCPASFAYLMDGGNICSNNSPCISQDSRKWSELSGKLVIGIWMYSAICHLFFGPTELSLTYECSFDISSDGEDRNQSFYPFVSLHSRGDTIRTKLYSTPSSFPEFYGMPSSSWLYSTFDKNGLTFVENLIDGSVSFTHSAQVNSWQSAIFLARRFSGNDRCLVEFNSDYPASLSFGFVPTSERANVDKDLRNGKGYMFHLERMVRLVCNSKTVKYFSNYNQGVSLFALLLDLASQTLTLYISKDGTREGMRYAGRALDIAVDSYRAAISMFNVGDKMTVNGIYCNETIPGKYSEPIPFLWQTQSSRVDAFEAVDYNGAVTFTRLKPSQDTWRDVIFDGRQFSGNDKCLVEFKIDVTKNGEMLFGFVLPSDKSIMTGNGFVFRIDNVAVYSNSAIVQNMRKLPNHDKAGPRVYSLLLNLETRCLRVYFSDTGLPENIELLGEVTGIAVDAYRLGMSMRNANDKVTFCNVFWNENIPQRYFQL